MCIFKSPKVAAPAPTVTSAPPPEKPPEELEDAVDSNASLLRKKKAGGRSAFGRGASGAQYSGSASGSGLKISK